MSIVLDENAWAGEAIRTKTLGKKPFETLYRVARFYMDNGKSKNETRLLLDKFLIQCNPTASLPKWSVTLDNAIKRASACEAVKIPYITVTDVELDTIKEIKGVQLQRLAFTLLCLAKYYMTINPKTDGWVSMPDNEIMHMANINTSHVRQDCMYNTLYELGLIQLPRRVDSTSVRVCFIADGNEVFRVDNLANLGYQFMMLNGDKNYYKCANCGKVVKRKHSASIGGRPPKYCQECSVKIRMRQNINSVMRLRI